MFMAVYLFAACLHLFYRVKIARRLAFEYALMKCCDGVVQKGMPNCILRPPGPLPIKCYETGVLWLWRLGFLTLWSGRCEGYVCGMCTLLLEARNFVRGVIACRHTLLTLDY